MSDDTLPRALLCFSHLRWDFVFQRPQHLMTRFAKVRAVYYIEEPVFEAVTMPTLRVSRRADALRVVVPVLPHGADVHATLRALLDGLLVSEGSRPTTAGTTRRWPCPSPIT